jgi:hypothetical protein
VSGRRETSRWRESHQAVWDGRSGQDSCWKISRIRSARRVEVANLVPLKTATLGVAAGGSGHLDRHFAKALVADDLAADQEGVAGGEGGGEAFLDLAEGGALVAEADLEGFDVDDGAEVLADEGGGAGIAQVPFAAGLLQALPAVVGFQRVAAGGDEIEAGVELGLVRWA